MRKVFAIMVLMLLTSTSAFAQATGLAVGYDQNIQGISLRYMPGGLGFEGILGFSMEKPESDAFDTAIDVNLGANVLLPLATTNRFRLNGVAGIEMFRFDTTASGGDAQTDFGIIAGLEPEFFILDNLSVSTKMGVELYFRNSPGDDNDDTFFETFGTDYNLLDGLSLHYYF